MSKIYFKATRPDGTDFRTGTVDYAKALETGKPLARLTDPNGSYACCTNTVYHASDVAAETLIGGAWPCRLFEVTGRPVASEGHKYGFRSLRVTAEIDATLALGPNGAEVAALIERAKLLTPDEARRLAGAAWGAARGAAWGAAWDAARGAAWGAARGAARGAAWGAAWDAAWGAAWGAARGAARGAAWGAEAILVKDLINTAQYDILIAPWLAAVGSDWYAGA